MDIVRYSAEFKNEWDSFVPGAKNATFLFMRDYMDYHADRFVDASLMFYEGGILRALLPANYRAEDKTVLSHGGLTYGGFILSGDVRGAEMLAIFEAAMSWMKEKLCAVKFIYKPVPYIYSSLPSQEDLYALFRVGARLSARSLSSAIENGNPLPFSTLRRRKVAKAAKCGVNYMAADDFTSFWRVLSDVLASEHGCAPVHSLDEILLLHSRFPQNIKLYAAYKDGAIIAGCVVYETARVAHVQYIASSPEGKACGALDGLFDYMFNDVYTEIPYIDFGISTECGGRYLNEGLLFQKEGFGGRGVVYDAYEMEL